MIWKLVLLLWGIVGDDMIELFGLWLFGCAVVWLMWEVGT